MGMSVNTPRTWRFGVFELDASSGELRRNGTVIKLREQPERILLLLLEHAGQMVTCASISGRRTPSSISTTA
jgi:DNA-binding winged helix-turn-helix (wHTH) protein